MQAYWSPEGRVLAVTASQGPLDTADALAFAYEHDVQLAVFVGWMPFVEALIFWTDADPAAFTDTAYRAIHRRLDELEVSEAAIALWAAAGGE